MKNQINELKPKKIQGSNSYIAYCGTAKGNKKMGKPGVGKNVEFCVITDLGDQLAFCTNKQTISIYKEHLREFMQEVKVNGKRH